MNMMQRLRSNTGIAILVGIIVTLVAVMLVLFVFEDLLFGA
jgi:hypothetical protein